MFGIVKQAMGFRQFLLRGIDNVEWGLVTLAYNCRRLHSLQEHDRNIRGNLGPPLRVAQPHYSPRKRFESHLAHFHSQAADRRTHALQLREPLLKGTVNPVGRSMSDRLLGTVQPPTPTASAFESGAVSALRNSIPASMSSRQSAEMDVRCLQARSRSVSCNSIGNAMFICEFMTRW